MDKLNDKEENQDTDDMPEGIAEEEQHSVDHHGRKRRRIKVRRRIRIKKRTSPKKKAKKTMETVAWVLIIAAFVMTLIILILQLDLNDKRTKKSLGKEVSMVMRGHSEVLSLNILIKVTSSIGI